VEHGTVLHVVAVEDDVLTSSYAAGVLIRTISRNTSPRAAVVGSPGLIDELKHFGIEIVSHDPCEFLVVGLDEEINYRKISFALDVLLSGAPLSLTWKCVNIKSQNELHWNI
jgi:ribonucleotide monophosphatase NagD (HAD superfamily)